jgi:excisionase family DNA binding protein
MTDFNHQQPPPTAFDVALADSAKQILARCAKPDQPLQLLPKEGDQRFPITLPAGAVTLLMHVLEAIAAGQSIQLIAENTELTVSQAADLLSVSPSYLIGLLEADKIPFRVEDEHYCIRTEDLMAYKEKNRLEREKILDELVAESQAMGLYDIKYNPLIKQQQEL